MTDVAPRDDALIGWLQATALAARGIDQLPLEDRRTLAFLRGLYGYLNEMQKKMEPEAQQELDNLRIAFERVLAQLKIDLP